MSLEELKKIRLAERFVAVLNLTFLLFTFVRVIVVRPLKKMLSHCGITQIVSINIKPMVVPASQVFVSNYLS